MCRFLTSFERLLASLLVLTVLTNSIALAAYLCPEVTKAPMPEMVMDDDTPCAEMDKEKPVQCVQQVSQSSAQLALEHLATAPALTPITASSVMPAMPPVLPSHLIVFGPDILPDAGTDPPYLRTQRLRI